MNPIIMAMLIGGAIGIVIGLAITVIVEKRRE